MDQNQVFAALANYQFETVNGVCCGAWKGYAVALRKYMGTNYYLDVALRVRELSAAKKAIKRGLKESGRKLAKFVVVWDKGVTLTVSFPTSEEPASRFSAVMEEVTAVLGQSGLLPADTCAVTGEPNPDSLCLIAGGTHISYQPVNGAAVREQNAQTVEKIEENENNGSLTGGILGAILGAAVGIAVNVLIIVFTQRIFSIAFALVPLAAMFGYKLFKGKTNKTALIVVIVLSVIAVPLMCILSYGFYVAKEYDLAVGEVFSIIFELLGKDKELTADIFSDLPMMILFMALGVLIAWRYLGSSINSTQLKASSAQISSLRPNPNYGSFGQQPQL